MKTKWAIRERGARTIVLAAESARDALLDAQLEFGHLRNYSNIHGGNGVGHERLGEGGWRYVVDGGRRIVEVTRHLER